MVSAELNEILAGNAATELLSATAFGDTAEIDRGEAEALDEVDDSGPRRCVVARDEQDTTTAERRWVGPCWRSAARAARTSR